MWDDSSHDGVEAKEARQGQVSEQLENLEKAIEYLANQVDRVEDRLKPILGTQEEGMSKAAVDKPLVSLAEHIRNQTHCIRTQATRLIDILERLEL